MKRYLSRLTLLSGFISASLVVGSASVRAADWPHWRGPNFDGSSDAKNLPEKFGKEENLLWKATLPGPSNSTPIIFGDKVFVSAIDSNKKLQAICLDRKEGKILWQKEVGIGFYEKGENNMATPSPTTDGKTVWFLYGTGDLAAFDMEGKQLWARNIQKDYGPFNIMWIYGSSPTLYKGKLFVQVLHTDHAYKGAPTPPDGSTNNPEAKSYLLALDPATGKEIWKHLRPDEAASESKESYGSPIPHKTAAGREEIMLIGGDCVTGHDPETGKELWRFTGWNPQKIGHWRVVPSPVAGGGVILGCAPKGGPVMAYKEDGSGNISESGKLWWSDGKKVTSDVCVPLYYESDFFILDPSGKKLHRVEPKTGNVKWTAELGGNAVFRGSPTGADGKIYCNNVNGDIWVVSPADGKVLHKTSLDSPKGGRGSIAVSDGILVVRAGENLYAFGKK